MNRADILEKARILHIAGFGKEDVLTLLIAIADKLFENKFISNAKFSQISALAEELEVALSNKDIKEIIQGISYLHLDNDKILKEISSWDPLYIQREPFIEKLKSFFINQQTGNLLIEPNRILNTIDLCANWAQHIINWCLTNGLNASPVFWSNNIDDIYPIAKPIGSFATSEVILLAIQNERYDIKLKNGSSKNLIEFFEIYLNRYLTKHPALKGAIAFDELDDDYPGSDAVSFEGLHLTCPTVNSSAQALLVCSILKNHSLEQATIDLLHFILKSQNMDGSWPIHRFDNPELCHPQVMSSSLAMESLSSIIQKNILQVYSIKNYKQIIENALNNSLNFTLAKLDSFKLINFNFDGNGDEFGKLGATAIAFQGILEVLKHNFIEYNNRNKFWLYFEYWANQINALWKPDWRNVIKIRIPVPQWGGTFDPGQFTWELPLDAIIVTVLIEAEINHKRTILPQLAERVYNTIFDTLSIQNNGIWRDIPMAVIGNNRGFPQNAQIYERLLSSYLVLLNQHVTNMFK